MDVPEIVATKSSRRPRLAETAAELERSASPEKANEAALSVARPAANDGRKPMPTKPAIVATASRKLTKLHHAERAADDDPAPDATARAKAFIDRMIRPGGALPPEKP